MKLHGQGLGEKESQGQIMPFTRCGLPGGSDNKESACNVGDVGSIPGLEKCPGEGNGYPLLYSCLDNSMDRRARCATVYGVARSQT